MNNDILVILRENQSNIMNWTFIYADVRRKNERNMKRLVTICLILLWVVSFGCKQEKIIPEISPGRAKLLQAGLAIEAIEEHLKLAEVEEEEKNEVRALLLIGYSHALSVNIAWLRTNNKESEYKNERARRLAELNLSEMQEICQVLDERNRVQKDTIQILIDKGTPVIPLLIKSFIENRYTNAHSDFDSILIKIGSKGLDELFTAVDNTDTPVLVRDKLIRIIGDIGDSSAKVRLESLKDKETDAGLKMEIITALYRLGTKSYQKDIETGLDDTNVVARRAAARSMILLNQPSTSKMVKALKDTDDLVRISITRALQKHVDANAVDNLVDMLINDSSIKTKKVVVDTLNLYVEKGIVSGLAPRLIELLLNTPISNHEDRVLIVQLLSKPALIKEIQEADQFDNLPFKLDDYYREKESNPTVKNELNSLLLILEEPEE